MITSVNLTTPCFLFPFLCISILRKATVINKYLHYEHSSIIFSFCNIKLYHNPVAMIHFMLDNLRHPAGIFPMLLLEMLIEVIDFYLLISRTWACPVERQTSLFHLIRARFLRDNRIHHRELERSACHDDDILLYADHIGRHADTMVQIRPECIEQICYNLFICFRCIHRFLCQEQRIPHNFLYHIYPFKSKKVIIIRLTITFSYK